MPRLLKIILSIFSAIVLLVIIAAVVLPLVINPNDFKPEIQAAVKNSLGRELIIDGDLELSVFPWIGVSTGQLTLSNAEGFTDKPFAEIKESNVKVKLIPLLSKKLEVSRIVLKGLNLNLAKNKQGVSNWDDFSSSEKTATKTNAVTPVPQEGTDVLPLAALVIGGISIEQAQIVWDDQQQDKHTEIKDFNFKTDKLVFDQPIAIDLSFMVVNKEPKLTETIKLTTDLVINEALDVFNLKQFYLESITQGKDMPGEKIQAELLAEVDVDLTQQTLKISGLNLNSGDLNVTAEITGNKILDKPEFSGPIQLTELNLAQWLKNMAMPLPPMQDVKALNRVSANFEIQATSDSAEIKNLVIKLDDTNITGSGTINNFAKPAITVNLHVDDINADRYMAPAKEGSSPKTIATPASAAAATATLFPVEALRAFNANGKLSIDKLKINNLKMQGLGLKLNAKNGLIKTKQTVKQLYQGAYNGNTTINVKNKTPVLALNEKLLNVQIEPLLKDLTHEVAKVTGLVNATAKIQGRGNTSQAIKSTLNGQLNFNFKDGVVRGFNLQKIIDNGKALIDGTPLPTDNKDDQTVFSVMKGTAKIKNGLVNNNDLYAEASKLRVYGKGTASLVSEKLDYKLNAKLIKAFATATEPEKIKGIPIILDVGGTFSEPTYTLDVAAMLMDKNKEKINKEAEKIFKKLDEKLGPGVGDLLKSFL